MHLKPVAVETVKAEVARWFRLQPHVVYSRLRAERIAFARQVAMAMAAELSGLTTVEIGEHFGRDHSCVSHALGRVSDRCDTEPQTKANIDALRAHLMSI